MRDYKHLINLKTALAGRIKNSKPIYEKFQKSKESR